MEEKDLWSYFAFEKLFLKNVIFERSKDHMHTCFEILANFIEKLSQEQNLIADLNSLTKNSTEWHPQINFQ